MDAARHQLLACAAFTADEHRHIGVRDASDQFAHLPHLRGVPQHGPNPVACHVLSCGGDLYWLRARLT